MPTPASFDQAKKLLDLFGGSDSRQMQDLIAHGYLLQDLLACPDLGKVNRTDFRALLHPEAASVAWTPVEDYADRIAARNDLCGWGLTSAQISLFGSSLNPHADLLKPAGLSLWLGRDLKYNWVQAVAWLEDEIRALDSLLRIYISSDRVTFWPGCEIKGPARLRPVRLDMSTTWHPSEGLIPAKVRLNRDMDLAGLEVAWTLALSPQIYLAIDGRMFPAMLAAGLAVDTTGVPTFDYNVNGPYLSCVEAGSRRTRQAVVGIEYY